ncbi:MAG: NADPH-dependent 7-cyano-7-deazaguanine reductase QueF [Woeseiaceae bacterium]|nr:NADPH-dependent 7-cyano-7-deazaguanine reductase QueF [Woeseiaceae bacterium]
MSKDLPLGRETDYPDQYAPELLFPIARDDSRVWAERGKWPPFSGVDIWNAWELTWLDRRGKPRVASAEIRVPAESPNIVESKSLKLYLNSFSMSHFASSHEVGERIRADLGKAAGAAVEVSLMSPAQTEGGTTAVLPGHCIDDLNIDCDSYEAHPDYLQSGDDIVEETLHTHLLRSLCPVTAQPDTGSLLIRYRGPAIDHEGLLRYVVSFRRHSDFHEACVERIFIDLKYRCVTESLTVYARYQRRGGIDINPYRSDTADDVQNLRLWRQ